MESIGVDWGCFISVLEPGMTSRLRYCFFFSFFSIFRYFFLFFFFDFFFVFNQLLIWRIMSKIMQNVREMCNIKEYMLLVKEMES